VRNARASSGVLLVFSWHGINVIKKLHLCPFGWHRCNFWIKKITFMSSQENTRRTPEDGLAFLIKSMGSCHVSLFYAILRKNSAFNSRPTLSWNSAFKYIWYNMICFNKNKIHIILNIKKEKKNISNLMFN
jgi:hypothetical protein